MLSLTHALNILELTELTSLIQLKDAYCRSMLRWHPDPRATKVCQEINSAYAFLELIALGRDQNKASGKEWAEYIKKQLLKKEVKTRWRKAYWTAHNARLYLRLHFSTCILEFKQAAIKLCRVWFLNYLYEGIPESCRAYRELSLAIAPNRDVREDWAKKYHNLEFGSDNWIFYLLDSVAQLTDGEHTA
ncbi:J domain-containing protein [Leptolyngbya sp. FACHB-16]|uniref:J domain-containing protein n=1 Tax=unclassified Leptolyngbya TaxID=2650499 RepID=UPI0016830478|nr:J domain-containing protein [Leptolyngbya sp. FACHB-16]MBD2153133.1 J domain-containing protein [Leptolyngbya sp. FACHB-16]